MTSRGIFDATRFVTGEAVEVDLPAAGLPVRMLSGLIDLALIVGVALLGLWLIPWDRLVTDAALAQVAIILAMVIGMAGIPIALETLTRGRTVGKMVMGLRTVREDTGPIGFRHAVIRALAGVFELWLTSGGLALVVAATNERARRIGDLLAGTYVVRDRVPLSLPGPAQTSPSLAAWASSLDIGTPPDALLVAARQFLARAVDLEPAARAATGHELSDALLRYTAPPPPPGAHPEEIIATVLATRRERDLARLERDDRLRERVLGEHRA